jgi:putative iron-dependent peroxidase
MTSIQRAILAPPPRSGRFLTWSLCPDANSKVVRQALAHVGPPEGSVFGVGEPLLRSLGVTVPGLRSFQSFSGSGFTFPSTQGALWGSLGGDDAGALLQQARVLTEMLRPAFRLEEDVPSFVFDTGRDLTGYQDGTENPKGDKAKDVAVGAAQGSFVLAQRWIHDLQHFESLPLSERNDIIGRDLTSNAELPDAPASAHVKRTAQESFDPTAFLLRRSMPWGDAQVHGLYFVAYAATLDSFERQLRRMTGADDGISDALMRFSRPVTGGYYYCPPVAEGRMVLD